jgi:hypothetical protein
MIMDQSEECILAGCGKSGETKVSDETEDTTYKKEEKRKKARLRRRGPYRKAHANW